MGLDHAQEDCIRGMESIEVDLILEDEVERVDRRLKVEVR